MRGLTISLSTLAATILLASTAFGDGPTGSFTAADNSWNETGSPGDHVVNIDPGGTVSFSYPSGGSNHNAAFESLQPTSCIQTAGANSGAVPPLPANPTAQGWTGDCTFATEGIYTFHCELHSSMEGTVIVGNPPLPPGGGTTNPPGGGQPGTTNSLDDLSVRRSQRGVKVKGSVAIALAGTDITVELKSKRKRVGRTARTNLPAGTARFTVALSRRARAALRRAGKLTVSAKVTLTAPDGSRLSATKPVKLKR